MSQPPEALAGLLYPCGVKGQRLALTVLDETFGICRLESAAPVPAGLLELEFCSVTRAGAELSIVAPEAALRRAELPAEARVEGGWACLAVEGPLELSLVGVLSALSGTLARAGVSLFAISTYDTDYLLVEGSNLPAAGAALAEAGHSVSGLGDTR